MKNIVLFTVNDTETAAINEAFRSVQPAKLIGTRAYWNLGILGGAQVMHAKTQMGDQSTASAARAAIESLSPKLMICVGVAWGSKPTKWKIGDLLLATRLHDWSHRKESDTGTIPRGFTIPPSDDLIQLVRMAYSDWKIGSTSVKPRLHEGLLLSNPVLYDNALERDKALEVHPEAIGGEMEGRGLVWEATQAKKDWLVVKAICDWGADKNTAEANKEESQKLAARNSAYFVYHLITAQLGPYVASLIDATHAESADQSTQTARVPEQIKHLYTEFRIARDDINGTARRTSLLLIQGRLNSLHDFTFEAVHFEARIWREMARNARNNVELTESWRMALKLIESLTSYDGASAHQTDTAYQVLADWSIDFSQSSLPNVPIYTTLAQLNRARSHLGQRIGPNIEHSSLTQQALGDALCLRSKCTRAIAGLLRRRAQNKAQVKMEIDKHKNDALHDSRRGVLLSPRESNRLELALCLLARSATPNATEAEEAMHLLEDSTFAGAGPLTRYELVKQYRYRYRFSDAIDTFAGISDRSRNRFLSNATNFAASVIGLHYERHGPHHTRELALQVLPWLEELISTDRHGARDVVDVCYLRAICGWNISLCIEPLQHLKPSASSTWTEIANLAKKVSQGDLGGALLLGLEDPVIWSRIGSFYFEFAKDAKAAIEFYDRASFIAPLSPVFHFNKAEALAYGLQHYPAARVSLDMSMRLKQHGYAWYRSIPDKMARLQRLLSLNLDLPN